MILPSNENFRQFNFFFVPKKPSESQNDKCTGNFEPCLQFGAKTTKQCAVKKPSIKHEFNYYFKQHACNCIVN